MLRADDRGVGGSSKGPEGATSEDYAHDALAGVEYLKTRQEINARRIGLIGHSEGGLIAPIAAAQSNDVSFIVLMAAPGVTGDKILIEQAALIAKAGGVGDAVIASNRHLQEQSFAIIKGEKDVNIVEKKIREFYAQAVAEMSEVEKKTLGVSPAAIDAQIKFMITPWFKYFLTYDPRPVLMKVRCPVLAINGELDLQVPAAENLAAIADALKAGGNTIYTGHKLAGLNHLFQRAKTGAPSEYGLIEETFSPAALVLISDWVLLQQPSRAVGGE